MKKNIPVMVLSLFFAFLFYACGSPVGGPPGSSPQTWLVTVNGGTGGGNYEQGATVTITASPAEEQTFVNWTVNSGGVVLADAASDSTTFTMPVNDVTVTANFSNPGDPECTHEWGEGWHILGAATCAAEGQQKRECTLCPAIEVGSIPKNPSNHTGHEKPGSITAAANCSTEGSRQVLCFDCDAFLRSESTPVNPTVHTWSTGWTIDFANANERNVCSGCGAFGDLRYFTTPNSIRTYLTHASVNGTLASPVTVKANPGTFHLGDMTNAANNWQQLLGVLAEAGDYVHLDLSGCLMTGTVFNPVSGLATGKDRIVSIILPDAALSIGPTGDTGTGAFRHFSNLRTASGVNVSSIGNFAFEACSNLVSVDFPALNTILQFSVFSGALRSASFPALTRIGSEAFRNSTVESLNIPVVTAINLGAFNNANNIANITIAANVDFQGSTPPPPADSLRFQHFISVYSSNGSAAGGYSWNGTAWVFDGIPSEPINLRAAVESTSSIRLSWGTAAGGATSYRIERSTNPDSGFVQVGTTPALSFTNTGLPTNTTYYYRVYSVNGAGTSTSYAAISIFLGLPPSPTGINVLSTSASHITIGWNAAPGATSYRIEHLNTDLAVIFSTTVSGTEHRRNMLNPNEGRITFRVYSVNPIGESPTYAEISAIMDNPPPPPTGAPLVTASVSQGGITLSWTSVANATGYRIERSTNNMAFSQVMITSLNDWTDTNITAGTTYYYRVYAGNSGGYSSNFGSAQATAQPVVSLIGTWNGTGLQIGSTYVFGENGYLSLNGVTYYTWHISGNNIVVSYQGTVAATVPYSISGNNLTLSGNSNVLVAGTYTR